MSAAAGDKTKTRLCDICQVKAVWVDRTECGVFAYCRAHMPLPVDVKVKKHKHPKGAPSFDHIFTEAVVRDLHRRFVVRDGRSKAWLSRKKNTGLIDCSRATIRKYLKKYGLDFAEQVGRPAQNGKCGRAHRPGQAGLGDFDKSPRQKRSG